MTVRTSLARLVRPTLRERAATLRASASRILHRRRHDPPARPDLAALSAAELAVLGDVATLFCEIMAAVGCQPRCKAIDEVGRWIDRETSRMFDLAEDAREELLGRESASRS